MRCRRTGSILDVDILIKWRRPSLCDGVELGLILISICFEQRLPTCRAGIVLDDFFHNDFLTKGLPPTLRADVARSPLSSVAPEIQPHSGCKLQRKLLDRAWAPWEPGR